MLNQELIALKRIQAREEKPKALKQDVKECLMIAVCVALFSLMMMILAGKEK